MQLTGKGRRRGKEQDRLGKTLYKKRPRDYDFFLCRCSSTVEHGFRKAGVEGSSPSIGPAVLLRGWLMRKSPMGLKTKYNNLRRQLGRMGRVLVAYSGGVDSVFLAKAAADCLGAENVLACIGVSPSLSAHQLDQARQMAAIIGVRLLEIPLDELKDPNYQANKADRCFHCKSRLYKLLTDRAKQEKIQYVLCGSNSDDKDDYRPGSRAAEVFAILSPMMDAGLTKKDIRQLSREMNLPTADLPASPCLASRVAYGLEITEEKLAQVEKAEDFLRSLGFVEFRVRHHGDIARIEINPQEFAKIAPDTIRNQIADELKKLGFRYITLDLQGFRSGSMNEILTKKNKKTLHRRGGG